MTTILVNTHLSENQPYLDLCLKAIQSSVGTGPVEIIVMSSAKELTKVPEGVRLIQNLEMTNGVDKVNRWTEIAHKDSDCLVYISDDVVVSQDTIAHLEKWARMGMIAMPLCNADAINLFHMDVRLGGKKMTPEMVLEDVEGLHEEIINYQSSWTRLVEREWVPFFSFSISRQSWDKIGQLDPALCYRHDDQDYCRRAKEAGVPVVIDPGVFALHFGSRSIRTVPMEKLDQCTEHYMRKWAGK